MALRSPSISLKGALWALLMLLPLGVAFGATYSTYYGRSAFHTGAHGTGALYRLVQEAGWDVSLWDRPLWGDLSEEGGLVLLLAPTVPLESEELDALFAHVQGGGRLLFVGGAPGPGEGDLSAALQVLLPLGIRVSEGVVGEPGVTLLPLDPLPKGGPALEGAVPMAGGLHFDWLVEPPQDAHVLLRDDRGMRAVAFGYGRGVVIAVADLTPFSNRWLGEAEAGAFVLGLIDAFRGERPILWDVFHHGFGAQDDGLDAFIRSPMAIAGIHGLLVGALGLIWFGRREVGAKPWEELPPLGGPEEEVEALAGLYGKTGGHAMALEPILRENAQRATSRLGLAPELDPEEALGAACEALGLGRSDLLGLIAKAREESGEGAAIALIRRLDKMLGRLEDVPR